VLFNADGIINSDFDMLVPGTIGQPSRVSSEATSFVYLLPIIVTFLCESNSVNQ
jgi:hypothetical protein